jgi:uncharacterized protein DUF2631
VASSSTPARQAHGEVAQGDSHHAVVVNGVSSDDEPSVEWGWHAHYPKVARFAGFLVAAILLTMLWGNHVGRQEDIWLVVLAVGFFGLSIGAIIRSRTSWRR